MSEIPQVSNEFIEENKKLDKTRQKKGGRYSEKDRFSRRQEVYKFHFELGYSGIKIAELMKINRHTIESDIKFWYSRLTRDWHSCDIEGWCMRQLNRLESQRTRLLEQLDNQPDLDPRISIEKLVLEIDDKIMKILISMVKTNDFVYDSAIHFANKWMEFNKIDHRLVGQWEAAKMSKTAFDKIRKIIKEDNAR